jgi:hypothetical protein
MGFFLFVGLDTEIHRRTGSVNTVHLNWIKLLTSVINVYQRDVDQIRRGYVCCRFGEDHTKFIFSHMVYDEMLI